MPRLLNEFQVRVATQTRERWANVWRAFGAGCVLRCKPEWNRFSRTSEVTKWRRRDEDSGDHCASVVGTYLCFLRSERVASVFANGADADGTGRAVYSGVRSVALGDDCGDGAGDRGVAIAGESICAAGVGAAGSSDCEHSGFSFADESCWNSSGCGGDD